MQAVILAAGMGKRLKQHTACNTKCMVKVNGVTLIDRMLKQLVYFSGKIDGGISRIIIVTGYEGDKLKEYISTLDINAEIVYIENPVFDKTNNIYSLALAKDYLIKEDTLLLESDLIFEDSVLSELLDDPRDTLALVDKYESWMDGTVVRIDDEDNILEFLPGKKFRFEDISSYYKTVNIYKFSKHFSKNYYVPFLQAYTEALGNNEYYEQVLRVITILDDPEIKAKRLSGQLWYEIDDIQDLDIAASMFNSDSKEKMKNLQNRFGGYWRYPKLIDFCYLVNPYFPPQKLIDEIKASFDRILCQYPSGMRVNTLLAAKNFGVDQDYIVVGNGAAELIKVIIEGMDGKIGLIKPTFDEYPNRHKENNEIFIPQNRDFSYDEDDIISYFNDKEIEVLVLINPDNPSGNYIDKAGIAKLLKWSADKKIKIIVDESFADFSDEIDNTLIDDTILENYPELIVIKSISKSYGVPGLRLGVALCSDKEYINRIKTAVSIWNINSFAEFYMQIAEKYNKDYQEALERFRNDRTEFSQTLSSIKGIRVIPSQANYFMCELEGIKAAELTERLLTSYNILIKDLTGKKCFEDKEYVRIAIRSGEDNTKLAEALKEIPAISGN